MLLWFGLWAAYQVAEIAAASAIGSLSLCGSDASAEEQVVIAFWAPFLLLHLGGPDTMTAYALEDNTMSLRKLAEMVFHIWGAFYVQYKYIYRLRSRSWTLLATASAIMLLVGAVRYAERSYALWKSNNIMEDDDEEDDAWSSSSSDEVAGAGAGSTTISISKKLDLDDDEALRLAQDLFHVCRRALADSSVVKGPAKQDANEKIFQLAGMGQHVQGC